MDVVDTKKQKVEKFGISTETYIDSSNVSAELKLEFDKKIWAFVVTRQNHRMNIFFNIIEISK